MVRRVASLEKNIPFSITVFRKHKSFFLKRFGECENLSLKGSHVPLLKRFSHFYSIPLPVLTSDRKSVFAFWTDYRMLALCPRQSENCRAGGAFAIDVSFAVTEFISFKPEEITEFLILSASFCYIARHRSKEDVAHERDRDEKVDKIVERLFNEQREYHVKNKQSRIDPKQGLAKRVVSISSVHKSVKLVFEFSH